VNPANRRLEPDVNETASAENVRSPTALDAPRISEADDTV